MDTPAVWEVPAQLLSNSCFILRQGRFLFAGYTISELLGVSAEQLSGQSLLNYISPKSKDAWLQLHGKLQQNPSARHGIQLTVQPLAKPDSLEIQVDFYPLKDDNEQLLIAGVVEQEGGCSEIKKELDDTRLQLNAILENVSSTIYQTNMQGEITLISSNVEALMGYTQQEVIGTKMVDYYWTPADVEKSMDSIMKNDGAVTHVDTIMRHKNGSPVWVSGKVYLKKNASGEAVGTEGVGQDISYQKKLEHKLESLALSDILTNLPNRRALIDELHLQFVESRKNKQELSVAYMNVNGMKQINRSYGQLCGDHLIKHVAEILQQHVSETITLGRLFGDEYLFILPHYSLEQTIEFINPVIRDIKNTPLRERDIDVAYSMSIGISKLKKSDMNEFALLDRAGRACLVARQGKSAFEVM